MRAGEVAGMRPDARSVALLPSKQQYVHAFSGESAFRYPFFIRLSPAFFLFKATPCS